MVFENLKPVKKAYRRFKIKTVEGPNDYAALQEMLYRRFKRAQSGDPGFAVLPDLILMDGGIGQVTSAEKVLKAMGVQIPVLGMAKDDSHRTRALVNGRGDEFDLSRDPVLFRYCGRIQEEVHRFAIEYHRNLRGKKFHRIGSGQYTGHRACQTQRPAGSLRFHRRDKESFRRRTYRGAGHHTAKRRSDKGILCQSDASLDEVSGFICASRAHFSFR